MDLTDVIGMYERVAESQFKYWNIYWLVAISILGLLWKEKRTKGLKTVLISGFAIFAVANLLAIGSFQKDLINLADGINEYIEKNRSEVIDKFGENRIERNPLKLILVVFFHIVVSFAFIVSMVKAKTETAEPGEGEDFGNSAASIVKP